MAKVAAMKKGGHKKVVAAASGPKVGAQYQKKDPNTKGLPPFLQKK
jgi:hypothetical protein